MMLCNKAKESPLLSKQRDNRYKPIHRPMCSILSTCGGQCIEHVEESEPWVNDWAEYRAVDANGELFEYKYKPNFGTCGWLSIGIQMVIKQTKIPVDFTTTLEKRIRQPMEQRTVTITIPTPPEGYEVLPNPCSPILSDKLFIDGKWVDCVSSSFSSLCLVSRKKRWEPKSGTTCYLSYCGNIASMNDGEYYNRLYIRETKEQAEALTKKLDAVAREDMESING